KTTIFTTDIKNFQIINQIYENFFIDNNSLFPARSCVEVTALPKNVKIEIEAIACYKIS
ncbi:MAG: Rid family hydrolase, partial [Buchnera aphidicola]|nr:Rid family hydrolase [Buchnera aphidicola]